MKQKVKQIISRAARIDINLIQDNSSLRHELWIDSLKAVQIIALIEEEFGLKIDEVEVFNVDSVLEIMDLIKEYRSYQE
jgi:acyl carrier protein